MAKEGYSGSNSYCNEDSYALNGINSSNEFFGINNFFEDLNQISLPYDGNPGGPSECITTYLNDKVNDQMNNQWTQDGSYHSTQMDQRLNQNFVSTVNVQRFQSNNSNKSQSNNDFNLNIQPIISQLNNHSFTSARTTAPEVQINSIDNGFSYTSQTTGPVVNNTELNMKVEIPSHSVQCLKRTFKSIEAIESKPTVPLPHFESVFTKPEPKPYKKCPVPNSTPQPMLEPPKPPTIRHSIEDNLRELEKVNAQLIKQDRFLGFSVKAGRWLLSQKGVTWNREFEPVNIQELLNCPTFDEMFDLIVNQSIPGYDTYRQYCLGLTQLQLLNAFKRQNALYFSNQTNH